MVDTEGVDVAGVTLSGKTFDTADPFAAVAQVTDTLDAVRAVESSDVEIPCKISD